MTLTRRNWLSLTGRAGAGLLTAGGIGPAFGQLFRAAQGGASAAAQTLTTACALCDSACGVTATVRDGVLAFLEGLPGDNQGGGGHLCGKGASGAAFMYDPNRLKYPTKRTNPRKGLDEDPGWVRITWQEALDTIADRFRSYRFSERITWIIASATARSEPGRIGYHSSAHRAVALYCGLKQTIFAPLSRACSTPRVNTSLLFARSQPNRSM